MTIRLSPSPCALWLALGLVAALLAVLVLAGCAVPVEAHGGVAPRPALPDAVFVGAGAALDGALAVAKIPTLPRLAADAGLLWAVRWPRWGGRTEGAHLLVFSGAFVREWIAGIRKAVRQ